MESILSTLPPREFWVRVQSMQSVRQIPAHPHRHSAIQQISLVHPSFHKAMATLYHSAMIFLDPQPKRIPDAGTVSRAHIYKHLNEGRAETLDLIACIDIATLVSAAFGAQIKNTSFPSKFSSTIYDASDCRTKSLHFHFRVSARSKGPSGLQAYWPFFSQGTI